MEDLGKVTNYDKMYEDFKKKKLKLGTSSANLKEYQDNLHIYQTKHAFAGEIFYFVKYENISKNNFNHLATIQLCLHNETLVISLDTDAVLCFPS